MKIKKRVLRNSSIFVVLTLLTSLLLVAGISYSAPPIRVLEGVVIKIPDGDTVKIRTSEGTMVMVRLGLIDAPETPKKRGRGIFSGSSGQPYGVESAKALSAKVMRRKVKVEVIDVDRYKRLVGIVYIGARSVNLEMVKEGYAWAYREYLSAPYASAYISAEDEARRSRRGLWRTKNPQPPWEHRKSLKIDRFR